MTLPQRELSVETWRCHVFCGANNPRDADDRSSRAAHRNTHAEKTTHRVVPPLARPMQQELLVETWRRHVLSGANDPWEADDRSFRVTHRNTLAEKTTHRVVPPLARPMKQELFVEAWRCHVFCGANSPWKADYGNIR